MRGFKLAHPPSLQDAISLLDTDDETVRPFSGGTALMLMIKTGVFQPSLLVNLARIEQGYATVTATAGHGLRLGAMATLTAVEHNADVQHVAPMLSHAMRRLSNVRVRNVARIGGNLAHGDPHMDLPPVLSALGGMVTITRATGARQVAVEALFTGYYETVLTRGELITEVTLPPQTGWASAYIKCTTRSYDDWPTLGVAVSLRLVDGAIEDCRIMVSAATEKLTRIGASEAVLRGGRASDASFVCAAEAAAAETEMIDDARGSAEYKTALLLVYLPRALAEAVRNGVVQ
jgi:carbon-monoxide dehydrogenase medium subunit